MKAEIIKGALTLTPENETESFALDSWFKIHTDECSFIMKPLDMRTDISVKAIEEDYPVSKEMEIVKVVKDNNLTKEQKAAILNYVYKLTAHSVDRLVNA